MGAGFPVLAVLSAGVLVTPCGAAPCSAGRRSASSVTTPNESWPASRVTAKMGRDIVRAPAGDDASPAGTRGITLLRSALGKAAEGRGDPAPRSQDPRSPAAQTNGSGISE